MGDYRKDNLSGPVQLHVIQGSDVDSSEKRLPLPEPQDFGLPGFLAGDSRLQFALARDIQNRLGSKPSYTVLETGLGQSHLWHIQPKTANQNPSQDPREFGQGHTVILSQSVGSEKEGFPTVQTSPVDMVLATGFFDDDTLSSSLAQQVRDAFANNILARGGVFVAVEYQSKRYSNEESEHDSKNEKSMTTPFYTQLQSLLGREEYTVQVLTLREYFDQVAASLPKQQVVDRTAFEQAYQHPHYEGYYLDQYIIFVTNTPAPRYVKKIYHE